MNDEVVPPPSMGEGDPLEATANYDAAAAERKPRAPDLLAAEGALVQHDAPFPTLFLPDQDTPIIIRE